MHMSTNRRLFSSFFSAQFLSGPEWDHRTEVRILGNETDVSARKNWVNLVFVCDWPEEEKKLVERRHTGPKKGGFSMGFQVGFGFLPSNCSCLVVSSGVSLLAPQHLWQFTSFLIEPERTA